MVSGRLYLQYVPDDLSRQWLTALQVDVLAASAGRATGTRQLHMTLLHIGVLKELWGELRRKVPGLEYDTVERTMLGFAAEAERLMPSEITVVSEGLDGFGPYGDVVALRIRLDYRLREIHKQCLELLVGRLHELLGDDPRDFMRHSPNLRFTLDAQPHITLVRKARHLKHVKVQSAELRLQAVEPTRNLR